MAMTNKDKYREFCLQSDTLPIFMQSWWLDAVCAGKEWDVLLSYDEQGSIQAAMPYLLRKRAWMKYIIMPQQTQIGGIWLRDDIRDDAARVVAVCQEFKWRGPVVAADVYMIGSRFCELDLCRRIFDTTAHSVSNQIW